MFRKTRTIWWFFMDMRKLLLCSAGTIYHVEWNLTKTTFNNFTAQISIFGGYLFLDNFINVWVWDTTKKFGGVFGAKPIFWDGYRPIPTTFGYFMTLWNSKNLRFSVFLGKFGNFFFSKYNFGAKLVLQPLKIVVLTLFRSWKWFISIFYPFLNF